MKKVYEAPEVEIELYQLDASIALNCADIVNAGPAIGDKDACSGYIKWEEENGGGEIRTKSSASTTPCNFYEGSCDCYYNAAGGNFFTS